MVELPEILSPNKFSIGDLETASILEPSLYAATENLKSNQDKKRSNGTKSKNQRFVMPITRTTEAHW